MKHDHEPLRPFTGLCLGGPLAGKMLSANARFHVCTIVTAPMVQPSPAEADRDTQTETFEYVHVEGIRGPVSLDFWIPKSEANGPIIGADHDDAKEIRYAIYALVDGYVRHTVHEQERAR